MKPEDKKTAPAKKAGGKMVKLKLVRSTCNTPEWMRVIVRTLALRKLQSERIVGDNPAIRGMVARVPHLVQLTEVKE